MTLYKVVAIVEAVVAVAVVEAVAVAVAILENCDSYWDFRSVSALGVLFLFLVLGNLFEVRLK